MSLDNCAFWKRHVSFNHHSSVKPLPLCGVHCPDLHVKRNLTGQWKRPTEGVRLRIMLGSVLSFQLYAPTSSTITTTLLTYAQPMVIIYSPSKPYYVFHTQGGSLRHKKDKQRTCRRHRKMGTFKLQAQPLWLVCPFLFKAAIVSTLIVTWRAAFSTVNGFYSNANSNQEWPPKL